MTYTRTTLLCGVLALVSFSASAGSSVQDPAKSSAKDAPTATEITKAGEIFAKACVSCHLPPDPERATDRAWLNQVKDTA